jgi:PAT family beta-lactamase induction signal transducer AmpG
MTVAAAHRPLHPVVYLLLYLPFGIAGGFVSVSLAWLLSHAGASVEAIAALAGALLLANTWKVGWSPLVDITFTTKGWYLVGLVVTALSLLALSLLPLEVRMLPVYTALAFGSGVAATLMAIAVDRLMAFDVPDNLKGRAGGWSQAGNLGGTGLGGGAGLWLAQHTGHPWIAGAALSLTCLPCAIPLVWLAEPGRFARTMGYLGVLKETVADLFNLVKRRLGILACFLMLLPIGAGGLQGLWAAIAKDWGAGADAVALVGGLLSGLVSLPGCILGGYIADRIDKKLAYCLFGIVLSMVAVAMAFSPRTAAVFLVFACLYNFVVGFCYGAYSAVTLEAIGKGAAATKFNLISSLSNAPILMVTIVDGWAATHYGTTGMLFVEAGMGITGVVFYALVALATRGMSWGVIFRRA